MSYKPVKSDVRSVRKPRSKTPGSVTARFRKDPSTRGLETVVVCISLPVQELVELDEACVKAQMARSHFLRVAAKHFRAFVLDRSTATTGHLPEPAALIEAAAPKPDPSVP